MHARHATIYGLDNTTEEVQATLDGWSIERKTAVGAHTAKGMYGNPNTGNILTTLVAAQGLQQMQNQKLPITAELIDAHAYGPYDTPINRRSPRCKALAACQWCNPRTTLPPPSAMKGFAERPKASMVYVTDRYTHGVFPYDTICVDEPVLRHLLGPSPNTRQINCPASGIALPLDQPTTKSAESTETRQRREWIDEFKKHIGRGAGL